ncbi:MAG: response regulator transcription factor [Nitrospirota bacterium]
MQIRVFLADDHAVVRDGLRVLLESAGGIDVVGSETNGRDAVRQIQKLRPDVALMDISMPGLNGIEAAAQINETCPATRVIILSMHHSAEHVHRALKAGAKGYILKESAGQEVVNAVRKVHSGQRYLSRRIEEAVIDNYTGQHKPLSYESPLDKLSSREKEILQLVAEGKSSAAIAETLFISPKTVETYRSRLMQKLGVKDIPSLVKFAIRHGVTSLDT